MNRIKIKKGDTVKVLTGKDNGKSGVVERVFAVENKAVVKGVHILKKHVKPSQKNPSGGIIDINKKMDVSDLMLVCPNCGKPSRVGYIVEKDVKIRVCKKCKKSVDGGAK